MGIKSVSCLFLLKLSILEDRKKTIRKLWINYYPNLFSQIQESSDLSPVSTASKYFNQLRIAVITVNIILKTHLLPLPIFSQMQIPASQL